MAPRLPEKPSPVRGPPRAAPGGNYWWLHSVLGLTPQASARPPPFGGSKRLSGSSLIETGGDYCTAWMVQPAKNNQPYPGLSPSNIPVCPPVSLLSSRFDL